MGFINLEWFSVPEHSRGPTLRDSTDHPDLSRQLSVRCANVHPVTCDTDWTAPTASELVARAVDHGVSAHGFNPGWYTRKRIAAISRAARGTRGDASGHLRSETDETTGQQMRDLPLDEVAAVLCVSPDILRAWEQRIGYPHSVFGAAGELRYPRRELIALRAR
jgi:hypothetical protein